LSGADHYGVLFLVCAAVAGLGLASTLVHRAVVAAPAVAR
jgi:hypothetical protein